MIMKRVMIGVVAVIVAGFSLSVFSVLWKLNRFQLDLSIVMQAENRFRWETCGYIGEVYIEEGIIEHLVLYREATIEQIA